MDQITVYEDDDGQFIRLDIKHIDNIYNFFYNNV
jgi:hypothetical protein